MSVRNTFAVSFLCESAKKGKDGLSPIYVSLSVNGKRIRFPVQRKADPKTFKKLLVSKKGNDTKDFCRSIEEKIYRIQTELINNSIPVTSSTLLEYFRNGGVKTYTLEKLWSDYMKIVYKSGITKCTIVRYENSRDKMFEKFGKDCEVSSITHGMLQDIYTDLKSSLYVSTASSKMQKIKSVIQYAFENGHIKSNPASGIRLNKQNKEAVWLTESEVDKIWFHDFSYNQRLENIRDLFILQCSCGLAYCDIRELKPEDIKVNGETYYIEKTRKKTGIKFTSVILPRGIEVIKKYNMNLPNIISNQKYNSFLHEIEIICGIKKSIHSHTSRHTYCTTLINRGVRLEVVARTAGHTNTAQSSRYAKLLNSTVLEEVSSKFNPCSTDKSL